MLRAVLCVAGKDVRLVLLRGGAFVQGLLLGLLLVFVFSLSQIPGQRVEPQSAATIFWLASVFCAVLASNMLYALEETTGARAALLLMPSPVQAVWLGKTLAGLLLLLAAQAVFFPAIVIFLGQSPQAFWLEFLLSLLLVDTGLMGLACVLGAFSSGQAARESLVSVLLFPLLIPLLLAGISVGAALFAGTSAPSNASADSISSWLLVMAAFDAVFLGAALALFPFVFGDDA